MKSTSYLILATAAILLSSCNTFIGMGRDLRIGGEAMESSANKVSGGGGSADTSGGAPVY